MHNNPLKYLIIKLCIFVYGKDENESVGFDQISNLN